MVQGSLEEEVVNFWEHGGIRVALPQERCFIRVLNKTAWWRMFQAECSENFRLLRVRGKEKTLP